MTIAFGPWSTGLGLAVAFAWFVAARLAFASRNRAANRWLAALLGLLALRVVVYVIGYAGFYDAHPWLSFAPLDLALCFGPLLWFHVLGLTGAELPPRWRWHLAPGIAQLAYYLAMFLQPLEFKNEWDSGVHGTYVVPLEQLATCASLAVYLWLCTRRVRAYDRWLVANVSDRDEHRRPWLWIAVAGLALVLAVQAAFDLTSRFVVRLDYFDRFPEYVAYAALLVLLALEAWRYAEHRFPPLPSRAAAPEGEGTAVADAGESLPTRVERDWAAQAQAWSRRIEAAGWWREPHLTLADVARRLGTNESYVSRALNEGLGQGFNEYVNRLRVRHVQAALDSGADGDLLALGLDAGFGSKASFNRAFRTHAGTTPAAYRAARAHASAAASAASRPAATSATVSGTTTSGTTPESG